MGKKTPRTGIQEKAEVSDRVRFSFVGRLSSHGASYHIKVPKSEVRVRDTLGIDMGLPLVTDSNPRSNDSHDKPSNFFFEAVGESKQTIGVRIENALLAEIHKQVAAEKERADLQALPPPTLTYVVEMLLRKGLRARREETRALPQRSR